LTGAAGYGLDRTARIGAPILPEERSVETAGPGPLAATVPPKAGGRDNLARFREILSDPLNLLIERVPSAGTVTDGKVVLHNGNVTPVSGPYAYYHGFSEILVLNRGVHEPLEEYMFQEMLLRLGPAPVMLELGAYWGHYSMWLKRARPAARTILVEPNAMGLETGRQNFALNGFEGEFIQAKVAPGEFEVDAFLETQGIDHLDVLHADIQGFEVDMLTGAAGSLERRAASYVFISTHGDKLHHRVIRLLGAAGYRVEVASDFSTHTTAYDGLVFASSPDVAPVAPGLEPLGREQIATADPEALFNYAARLMKRHRRRRAGNDEGPPRDTGA
jgi:hypothetical protein